jgi:hypothetical protein
VTSPGAARGDVKVEVVSMVKRAGSSRLRLGRPLPARPARAASAAPSSEKFFRLSMGRRGRRWSCSRRLRHTSGSPG